MSRPKPSTGHTAMSIVTRAIVTRAIVAAGHREPEPKMATGAGQRKAILANTDTANTDTANTDTANTDTANTDTANIILANIHGADTGVVDTDAANASSATGAARAAENSPEMSQDAGFSAAP